MKWSEQNKRIKNRKHLKTMKSHYLRSFVIAFDFYCESSMSWMINVVSFEMCKTRMNQMQWIRMRSKFTDERALWYTRNVFFFSFNISFDSLVFSFQCQRKMMNSLINICDGRKMFRHFFDFQWMFSWPMIRHGESSDNRQFIISSEPFLLSETKPNTILELFCIGRAHHWWKFMAFDSKSPLICSFDFSTFRNYNESLPFCETERFYLLLKNEIKKLQEKKSKITILPAAITR